MTDQENFQTKCRNRISILTQEVQGQRQPAGPLPRLLPREEGSGNCRALAATPSSAPRAARRVVCRRVTPSRLASRVRTSSAPFARATRASPLSRLPARPHISGGGRKKRRRKSARSLAPPAGTMAGSKKSKKPDMDAVKDELERQRKFVTCGADQNKHTNEHAFSGAYTSVGIDNTFSMDLSASSSTWRSPRSTRRRWSSRCAASPPPSRMHSAASSSRRSPRWPSRRCSW